MTSVSMNTHAANLRAMNINQKHMSASDPNFLPYEYLNQRRDTKPIVITQKDTH